MSVLMILLEIFSMVTCILALCFGILVIPYSIYNFVMFIIIKFKHWRYLNKNRKIDRKNKK